MRILVLSHEYPPIGGGGGHVAQDLCEGLASRGHEIKLITADLQGGLQDGNPPEDFELIRVPTLRKDLSRASLPAMVSFIFSAVIKGVPLIRRWRPDLIQAHFAVPSGPVAWLLSVISKVPYIITIHLGDIPGGTPQKTDRWFQIIKPLTYPIWRQAARIVAVSNYSRQLALQTYQVPIDVIHNGVDLSQFKNGRIEVHDPPRIVFAGRFVPQKNPLLVIQTLVALRDLDWELVMMGDGELFKAVQEKVSIQGLDDRISLSGWVSPEQVKQTFLASDILFMPSSSEGLPVVGVQALAAGLGLLVSEIGGFRDLVDQGENGYQVAVKPFNQENEYAARLAELLTDREQLSRFKENSLAKSKTFDLQRIVQSYESLMLEIASG